jgi:hypothetical protein
VTSYSLDARRIGTVHDANENSRRQPSTSPPVPRSCSRPPGTSRSSSKIVRGYRPPDPRGEEDLLDLCCKIVTPPFGGVAQRGCLAYRLAHRRPCRSRPRRTLPRCRTVPRGRSARELLAVPLIPGPIGPAGRSRPGGRSQVVVAWKAT